jgi:citronellol/citronellal dehydrogenase
MGYQSIFRTNLFAGKNYLITGGGSGIGRCVAHELASLGGHITLLGRTEQKLQRVAAEITEDGGSCDYYTADIRDEARIKKVVAQTVESRSQIDGLFNNAGGQFSSPIAKMSMNGFSAVVNSNLVGGFLVAREVFNQSMSKTGGTIVNMSGSVGSGIPNFSHSAAARAGMDNFTRSAAVEWAYAGVRVNSINLGFIESSGADSYNSGTEADNAWIETIKKMNQYVPLRRKGLEAEASAVVCFLFSDGASFMTGANVRVDGGMGLGVPWYIPKPLENEVVFDGFHRAVKPKVLGGEGE